MKINSNRISDRRVSNFDFRKDKINRRKEHRRKIDKINHSIYYVILVSLGIIMTAWLLADLYFLGAM